VVTATTCVASQKFVSSTARIISIVSPSTARFCAMMSVMKPMPAETTAPMPFLWNFSRTSPSTTAPQPMKMAEEYRLVTGGRPSSTMR
jgi:hypothetical protein